MDQHAVKIVSAQDRQLILDIAHDPFGGVVGITLAIKAPLRRRVTAEPSGDNYTFAGDFTQGQPQFTQRIAITARAVKMVHAKGDCMFDQRHRGFIFDKAKVVAKALGAKRDHGDHKFSFAETAAG